MLGFLLEGQPGRTLLLSFSSHLHWLQRQNKRWEAQGMQYTLHRSLRRDSLPLQLVWRLDYSNKHPNTGFALFIEDFR